MVVVDVVAGRERGVSIDGVCGGALGRVVVVVVVLVFVVEL